MRLIPALLVLIALLPAACTDRALAPTTDPGAEAAQANFRLITDIPIPSGASLDAERSLLLGSADRWTGRLVMRLNRKPGDSVQLYQQQMPGFGWQPVMSVQTGVSVLTFTRDDRAATVQVEPGSLWGSRVIVTVAPRAEAAAAGGGLGAPPPASAAPRSRIDSQPLR